MDFYKANGTLEYFKLKLKKAGLKLTYSRLKILEYILSFNKHFTAEELIHALLDGGLDISQGTVYRTLKAFCNCGVLHKISGEVIGGKARYEVIFDSGLDKEHLHFKCISCKKIFDYPLDILNNSINSIAESIGFEIAKKTFIISGKCKKCNSIAK